MGISYKNSAFFLSQNELSDVFSMGCIFYFIYTKGDHPFRTVVQCGANILCSTHSLKDRDTTLISLVSDMIQLQNPMRPSLRHIADILAQNISIVSMLGTSIVE